MQKTRQHVLRGREEEEPGLVHKGEHGGGGAALGEASEAEAAAEAVAAHQLSAAKQLLQMQRMLHSNAVLKAEEAIEKAEVMRETPTLAALTLPILTRTTSPPILSPTPNPTPHPSLAPSHPRTPTP